MRSRRPCRPIGKRPVYVTMKDNEFELLGPISDIERIAANLSIRERKRLIEWYGGPFNPDEMDLPTITARLGKLARRRAVGRAAYAKMRSSNH